MENYLINPVNPLTTLRFPAHSQKAWRQGSSGRFGKLAGHVARRKAKKAAKKAKRFGISTKSKAKRKTRRNAMPSPLMLINRKRRTVSRKRKAAPRRRVARRRKALAPVANPIRRVRRYARRSHRRTRRNPMILRRGSAAMSVALGAAYAFGGGAASTLGVNFATRMLPQFPILSTPLGKMALRLAIAAGLYQLHRVKVIGQKNAAMLAIGASIPVIGDVAQMVGAAKLLPASTPGVGILPKEYRSGTMSLIMPDQNMAGSGQSGW